MSCLVAKGDVIVTLDYFDGSESKIRTVDLEMAARSFAMLLLDPKVCGVTITKSNPLDQFWEKHAISHGKDLGDTK